MDGIRGVKRLLLGIDITILGGVLVGSSSGSGGALGVVVALGGLLVAISGMGRDAPA